MSEAFNKQAIVLGTPAVGKAGPSEGVLDLLKEIARGEDGSVGLNRSPPDSSAIAVHLEKFRYPSNNSRRHLDKVIVYSCASPAVMAVLQTLSEMFK